MAPNCPSEKIDALIAPDQMILQIHESIGHPLELDRILGDERNYAGSSFVNLDMFGTYKYGSDKLNISFNPTEESELATYNFDDDGTPAKTIFDQRWHSEKTNRKLFFITTCCSRLCCMF